MTHTHDTTEYRQEYRYMTQGGEDSQDPLSCGSLSTKEPLFTGFFCGKISNRETAFYDSTPPCTHTRQTY